MKYKKEIEKNNIDSNLIVENHNNCKNNNDNEGHVLSISTLNNKQIKSKERVNNHGEVLTPEWLVKDMLNLIPISAAQIESRYLENSVGEGVFLVEVLRRKLDLVFRNYNKKCDREFYTLVAVSNIYGFELLKDNIDIARLRLEMLIKEYFIKWSGKAVSKKLLDVIRVIIHNNIINMDSLRFRTPRFDESGKIMRDCNGEFIYKDEAIRISEWIFDYKRKEIKRIEYLYEDIVYEQKQKHLLNNKNNNSLNNDIYGLHSNIIDNIDKQYKEQHQLSFIDNLTFDKEIEEINQEDKMEIIAAKPVRIFESVYYLNGIKLK